MAIKQTPLAVAIHRSGGPTKLAKHLNSLERPGFLRVTPASIYQWTQKRVPAEQCPDVEVHTGVKCELLLPHVNWAALRGTQGPLAKEKIVRPVSRIVNQKKKA